MRLKELSHYSDTGAIDMHMALIEMVEYLGYRYMENYGEWLWMKKHLKIWRPIAVK